jgi:hydrogenase nickel incorporation protein HypA/HybF
MHEMGIALEIIDIVTSSIPEDAPDAGVRRVNLRIGKLSAVVTESLRFCFEIAVKDTPLAGAVLAIEEIPIVARCKSCRHQWTIAGPAFSCEKCSSGDIDLISGRELDVQSIEIADEEEHHANHSE